MKLGEVGSVIGRGLLAGLIGTAAITVSTTIEMKLRGRQASTAPADVALKLLRLQSVDEQAKARFSNMVHWGYGTGWGVARGVLDMTGCEEPFVDAAHFAAVWGTALIMLPALKVAPPVTQQSAQDVAIDAFHNMLYAAATGWAYSLLKRK